MGKNNLWFSILSEDARYSSDEENFIDPEKFDWTKDSKHVYAEIKQELLNYLSEKNLQSYFNTKMANDVRRWRTLSLKWWGLELYSHQKVFPKTTAFVKRIPNLVSASFSMLEPHTKIHPHCGDTNGIYRCHLGIIVPSGLPSCGFRVCHEIRAWKEGEWLIFIDAKEHEAWNDSNQNRIILLLDIIRPDYLEHKNKIVLTSLTGLFLQRRVERLPFLYKLQKFVFLRKIIVYLLIPFCYVFSKIRNVLSRWGFVS